MIPFAPGIYLKDSTVRATNLSPEILSALVKMRGVFASLSLPLVITSGNDGGHVPGSKHYRDDAVDVRSIEIPHRNRREHVGKALAAATGARLKLSRRPGRPPSQPVGVGRGLVLWVEEQPDSVPHFHLQMNRGPSVPAGGLAILALLGLGLAGLAVAFSKR